MAPMAPTRLPSIKDDSDDYSDDIHDGLTSMIIDIGSYSIKIGYSSDEDPTLIQLTVLAQLQNKHNVFGIQAAKLSDSDTINKIFPIQNGLVVDWAAIHKIFNYIWDKMNLWNIKKNWPHSNGPLKILIADTWSTGVYTGQRKKDEDWCRY
eukprot:552433_1